METGQMNMIQMPIEVTQVVDATAALTAQTVNGEEPAGGAFADILRGLTLQVLPQSVVLPTEITDAVAVTATVAVVQQLTKVSANTASVEPSEADAVQKPLHDLIPQEVVMSVAGAQLASVQQLIGRMPESDQNSEVEVETVKSALASSGQPTLKADAMQVAWNVVTESMTATAKVVSSAAPLKKPTQLQMPSFSAPPSDMLVKSPAPSTSVNQGQATEVASPERADTVDDHLASTSAKPVIAVAPQEPSITESVLPPEIASQLSMVTVAAPPAEKAASTSVTLPLATTPVQQVMEAYSRTLSAASVTEKVVVLPEQTAQATLAAPSQPVNNVTKEETVTPTQRPAVLFTAQPDEPVTAVPTPVMQSQTAVAATLTSEVAEIMRVETVIEPQALQTTVRPLFTQESSQRRPVETLQVPTSHVIPVVPAVPVVSTAVTETPAAYAKAPVVSASVAAPAAPELLAAAEKAPVFPAVSAAVLTVPIASAAPAAAQSDKPADLTVDASPALQADAQAQPEDHTVPNDAVVVAASDEVMPAVVTTPSQQVSPKTPAQETMSSAASVGISYSGRAIPKSEPVPQAMCTAPLQQIMEAYSQPLAAVPASPSVTVTAVETVPNQLFGKAPGVNTFTVVKNSGAPATHEPEVQKAPTFTAPISAALTEQPQASVIATPVQRAVETGVLPVRATVKVNDGPVLVQDEQHLKTPASTEVKSAAKADLVFAGAVKELAATTPGEDFGSSNKSRPDQAMNGLAQQAVPQQSKAETVAPAAPVASSTTSGVAEQVAKQVGEHIARNEIKAGSDQIVIRLNPDNLGELKVNLRMENQRVTIEIVTDNRMVRDSLLQNSDTLKESLAKQNIKMDSFDVSTGSNNQDNLASRSGRNQNDWQELAKNRQTQQWQQGGYNVPKALVPEKLAYIPRRQHTMLDVHF